MSGALFPPCCSLWGQVMVEVMKIMATSSKGPLQALLQSMPQMLQQATTNPHLRFRLLETPGQVWISLLWGHCSFLLGPGAFVCVLQESASSVLCEFLQLCGGVNGNLLQAGLCHTQVNCTQSPYPCSSPVMTRTSTEDTQTQFWLSLCVVSGSWCTQGLLELSEHLWLAWSLILNVIPPLLPSFWVFFVLKVSFFVGSNILLLMIVQLRGVILEFSQEKISTHHSTPP